MEWRASEIMLGQSLAEHCSLEKRNVKHYIVAKRHGPELIYELLFESSEARPRGGKKKIYASFPITKTFQDECLRKEVNSFRERLKNENRWIVFDPWTIDERSLVYAVDQAHHRMQSVSVKDQDGAQYNVSRVEALAIVRDIDAQIPLRDYQLIESCDLLVAYRAGMSEGVRDEIQYANQLGIPVYAVWPSTDSPPVVFRKIHLTAYRHNLDELLALI